MTIDQVDLFYLPDNQNPVGALVTRATDGEFSCHIEFSLPDGFLVSGDVVIQTTGSITQWTGYRFVGSGVDASGRKDGDCVQVGKTSASYATLVVPSYGLSGLVLETVASGADSVKFLWLDESAASAEATRPAVLALAGTEDLESPLAGWLVGCTRLELTVDGSRTNTYWVRDSQIVVSDWGGARSYALPSGTVRNLRTALGATR